MRARAIPTTRSARFSIGRPNGLTLTIFTSSRPAGAEERRTLAFRDYLRDHRDAAREYEQVKHRLAAESVAIDSDAREAYARAKTDFIERIVATALAGGYPRDATL